MHCVWYGSLLFHGSSKATMGNPIPNMITLYLFISTATNGYGLISLASYLASRDAYIFDGIV